MAVLARNLIGDADMEAMEARQAETTVRAAEAGNLPAMVRLLGELFSIEADFEIDPARQRRGLEMLLRDPERSLLLVAESRVGLDRSVAGMCSCQLLVSTAEGGLSGVLEDVVVAKGWRGLGLGRSLVERAAEWAAERGATRLQLLADKTNGPALEFYNRVGWSFTRLVCLRRSGL